MKILKLSPKQKCRLAPVLMALGIILMIAVIVFAVWIWYNPVFPEQERMPEWMIWLLIILFVIGIYGFIEGYIWLSYCSYKSPPSKTKKQAKKQTKTIKAYIVIATLIIMLITFPLWGGLIILAGTGNIDKFDYYVKALEYLWKGFQTYVNAVINLFKIAVSS